MKEKVIKFFSKRKTELLIFVSVILSFVIGLASVGLGVNTAWAVYPFPPASIVNCSISTDGALNMNISSNNSILEYMNNPSNGVKTLDFCGYFQTQEDTRLDYQIAGNIMNNHGSLAVLYNEELGLNEPVSGGSLVGPSSVGGLLSIDYVLVKKFSKLSVADRSAMVGVPYYFYGFLGSDDDNRGCTQIGTLVKFQKTFSLSDLDLIVALPKPPVKEGFNFVGWYYDEAFTNPYVSGTELTADISLFAKYEEIEYTYKVYGFNNKLIETGKVKYFENKNLAGILAPIVDKYYFDGWYTLPVFTSLYDMTKPIKANTSVYAKYRLINFHTVTFYVDGAIFKTLEVPYDCVLGSVPEAVKTAKDLAPLYSNAEMTEVIDITNMVATGNINLFSEGAAVPAPDDKPGADDKPGTDVKPGASTGFEKFLETYKLPLIIGGSILGVVLFVVLITSITSSTRRRR